jgi:hypothetical protein
VAAIENAPTANPPIPEARPATARRPTNRRPRPHKTSLRQPATQATLTVPARNRIPAGNEDLVVEIDVAAEKGAMQVVPAVRNKTANASPIDQR